MIESEKAERQAKEKLAKQKEQLRIVNLDSYIRTLNKKLVLMYESCEKSGSFADTGACQDLHDKLSECYKALGDTQTMSASTPSDANGFGSNLANDRLDLIYFGVTLLDDKINRLSRKSGFGGWNPFSIFKRQADRVLAQKEAIKDKDEEPYNYYDDYYDDDGDVALTFNA